MRSKKVDDIYEEAKKLVKDGYREIVLTGINTALYGKDLHRGLGRSMVDVINKIATITGDFRIRIRSPISDTFFTTPYRDVI